LAAPDFGDDGKFFQKQVRRTLPKLWGLGFEDNSSPTFVETYLDWAANA